MRRCCLLTTVLTVVCMPVCCCCSMMAVLFAHYDAAVCPNRLFAPAACRLCNVESRGRVIHNVLPEHSLGSLLAAVGSHVSDTHKWIGEVSNTGFGSIACETYAQHVIICSSVEQCRRHFIKCTMRLTYAGMSRLSSCRSLCLSACESQLWSRTHVSRLLIASPAMANVSCDTSHSYNSTDTH
jgi:hypothetical protein